MSTSIALVTWAEVSSERRMCSAMPRRMAVIGSSCSPVSATTGGGGGRDRRGLGLEWRLGRLRLFDLRGGRRLALRARGGLRLGSSLRGRGFWRRSLGLAVAGGCSADLRQLRTHLDRLALLHEDLRHRSRRGRGNLCVDLVG